MQFSHLFVQIGFNFKFFQVLTSYPTSSFFAVSSFDRCLSSITRDDVLIYKSLLP
uniref:Uncharacterized protein n=1 Tax=Jarrellvirus sp. TaxID=2960496 RepID=A0AAU8HXK9_9CAUD